KASPAANTKAAMRADADGRAEGMTGSAGMGGDRSGMSGLVGLSALQRQNLSLAGWRRYRVIGRHVQCQGILALAWAGRRPQEHPVTTLKPGLFRA
ncbi:MAG: hypothetical protein Q8L92_17530, partial [Rubrivivax sp.]|nr:hypothetical protein [Rubrivivax sp.]